MKFLVIFLFLLGLSDQAWSHARFLPGGNTPPRSMSPGIKTGPCGGIAKVNSPSLSFKSGQTIKLQWEETINHPGRFEFYLSQGNDQNFTLLLTVQDDQNSGGDLPHRYEADLKLPDGVTCTSCTLQMIQQMTENPASPRPYFSCVDLAITADGSETPEKPMDENQNTPVQTDCHP